MKRIFSVALAAILLLLTCSFFLTAANSRKYVNSTNPATTLSGAYTSGGASMTVVSASNLPSSGDFIILVGSEFLKVTAVSGTTLTVSGGQEGTSAANHSSGDNVYHVLTAGTIDQIRADQSQMGACASLPAVAQAKQGDRYQCTDQPYEWVFDGSAWNAFIPPYGQVYPPPPATGQTTTLNNGGTLGSGSTSCVVTSSSGFPSVPFTVQIASENIKVSNVSGTTWTIARGQDGTTGASHTDGSTITLLNYQIINQGGSTISQTTNGLIYQQTSGTGDNMRIIKNNAPTVAYTFTVAQTVMFKDTQASITGMILRTQSSGKMKSYGWAYNTGTGVTPGWQGLQWSASNASAGALFSLTGASFRTQMFWMRLVDDTTNVKFSVSTDGFNFYQIDSAARTTYTTADEYGVALEAFGATDVAQSTISWHLTTP